MTDEELIEQVATSLCQSALRSKNCPCLESGVFRCADEYPGTQARAALAAINLPARLEEAHTHGWNEAFEAAAEQCELWANKLRLALKNAQARKQWQEARDLESMVMSAFRAFQTRALTKENSDG